MVSKEKIQQIKEQYDRDVYVMEDENEIVLKDGFITINKNTGFLGATVQGFNVQENYVDPEQAKETVVKVYPFVVRLMTSIKTMPTVIAMLSTQEEVDTLLKLIAEARA
jgi:hypothetical protein